MKTGACFVRNTPFRQNTNSYMIMRERFNGLGYIRSQTEACYVFWIYTHNVKPVTRSFCGPWKCHLAKGNEEYVCAYCRGQRRGRNWRSLCLSDQSSYSMQDPEPHQQQVAMFTEIQREAWHLLVTMLDSTSSDVRGVFDYKAFLKRSLCN